MNIFNNIKSLIDNPQIYKTEVFNEGKRVSVGISMMNDKGRVILETYPKKVPDYGIVYVTTQWDNKGKKLYQNSYLNGREVSRLVKSLTTPLTNNKNK